MYSESDILDIRRKIARCAAALAVALAVLAALMAVSLYRRWHGAAIVAGLLTAVAAVFGAGFYILPCRRYLRFLTDLREGLSRELSGTVLSVTDAPVEQDGARVLQVHVALDSGEDERIVYLNASKRALFPEPGTRVRLTLCGRHVLEAEATQKGNTP